MPERGGVRVTGVLILLAVALGVADSLLPRPVPFMKIGLANVPAVVSAVRLGMRRTLALNTARSLTVALITGSLATPAFLMSMAGAAASAVIMSAASRGYPGLFSMTGVSICGACASLWGQLAVAAAVLPGLPVGALAFPVSLWGIGTGAVVGLAAGLLEDRLEHVNILSR